MNRIASRNWEKPHEKWLKLKKICNRKTVVQQTKEAQFSNDLDNLFDIAHQEALQMMKIQEDKDFLLAQREPGRRGCFGAVDKIWSLKEARAEQRKRKRREFKRKYQEKQINHTVASIAEISSSDEGNDNDSSSDNFEEKKAHAFAYTQDMAKTSTSASGKRGCTNVITSVAVALDRAKLSDRKATYV